MSKLWKRGRFITDAFVAVDDAEALRDGLPLLISLQRWREQRASVLAATSSVGVIVPPTAVLSEADGLTELALIAVPFAKFSDGRGYSMARRLRDQWSFCGELRATGEVLLDQLPLMMRCGFDSFAISHAPTVRELENGRLPFIAEVYQNAVFGRARTAAAFAGAPLLVAAE